ncbi:hypothetical protein CHH_0154 [Campylobacter hyointestinalis subsp. hyointestinalis LMG 9260]|nr:hypothetical protein CHH_0154 [Campylobacter hyointestinalis subsp. hyointestinalis LMG 9260]KEA44172.1 hypothetical protein CR67_07015 [Campylobacter hyointestinalis subsp. hyointestinalis]QKF55040.1 hypothetical protein CHHT_0154 [Campylobacter hyointestinalis subsp. hyointestinalis]
MKTYTPFLNLSDYITVFLNKFICFYEMSYQKNHSLQGFLIFCFYLFSNLAKFKPTYLFLWQ